MQFAIFISLRNITENQPQRAIPEPLALIKRNQEKDRNDSKKLTLTYFKSGQINLLLRTI